MRQKGNEERRDRVSQAGKRGRADRQAGREAGSSRPTGRDAGRGREERLDELYSQEEGMQIEAGMLDLADMLVMKAERSRQRDEEGDKQMVRRGIVSHVERRLFVAGGQANRYAVR